MKPHKHAELIKAWADGAEIQSKGLIGSPTYTPVWEDDKNPRWSEYYEYRIKPEPRPDVVKYVSVTFFCKEYVGIQDAHASNANLVIYFDGETGELKSAEVIK